MPIESLFTREQRERYEFQSVDILSSIYAPREDGVSLLEVLSEDSDIFSDNLLSAEEIDDVLSTASCPESSVISSDDDIASQFHSVEESDKISSTDYCSGSSDIVSSNDDFASQASSSTLESTVFATDDFSIY